MKEEPRNQDLDILNNQDLDLFKHQQGILKAELFLYEFLKQAWPIIAGSEEFVENWHIQAHAEHVQGWVHGQIRKLVTNVPPRSTKTALISIVLVPWVWATNPERKFMYASYASSLSNEQADLCLTLIESDWYQKRWGHLYKLTRKAKKSFKNNKGGYRFATSVGGRTTGFGADMLIVDDPNNVKDGESQAVTDAVIRWFYFSWLTRLNNPSTGALMVVQQRTGNKDITGTILEKDNDNSWTKFIIPMEYQEARKARTIILPMSNGKVWEDPRTKEGELLCEKRWSRKILDNLKSELGEYAFACQYNQIPAPPGGGIIKKAWFQWWKEETLPDIEHVIQSWDTALTTKAHSSYHACTTWGIFYDNNYIANIILLSQWHDRLSFPDLREMTKRLYFDYRDTGKERNPIFKGKQVDMCLIEAKASGDPLIQDLAAGGIRAVPFDPKPYGDKDNRVRLISPLIEGGRVWLPAMGPNYTRLLPFAEKFLEVVGRFPDPGTRDVVDTMSQALIKLKYSGFLDNPKDEIPILPSQRKIIPY